MYAYSSKTHTVVQLGYHTGCYPRRAFALRGTLLALRVGQLVCLLPFFLLQPQRSGIYSIEAMHVQPFASIVTQCMSLHSMQCRLVIARTLATLKYQLHIRNIMKQTIQSYSLVFGCCNHCKHNCGSTCCFSLLLQSGMQAVRENRYIILSKDFEKAYKKAIKKDDQEHDFYK